MLLLFRLLLVFSHSTPLLSVFCPECCAVPRLSKDLPMLARAVPSAEEK